MAANVPKRTADKVRRHARTLAALKDLDARARQSLMSWAKKELIATLVECAKLIINRRVPITAAQLSALRREASSLNALLSTPANKVEERRYILQKGGFLSALIAPIVTSVLPAVVKGVGTLVERGKQRRQARRLRRQRARR